MALAVVSTTPAHTPIGSDRVTISPTARLRFDELHGRVARIAGTMRSMSATPAAFEQAEAMLQEIAAQAHAARLALRRG